MNSNITKSEEEKPNKKDRGLIIAIGLLVFGLVALFFPFDRINGAKFGSFTIDIDRYNNLGDFIGGVTTPFLSIAAFILLYMTYKSQKEELKESRKILRTQNEVMTKQQFETTFFNMINLHNQIVNQISRTYDVSDEYGNILKTRKETKRGRECFDGFYNIFRSFHISFFGNRAVPKNPKDDFIGLVYTEFYEKRQSMLGHYFRNLYHIVKFVDNANIKNKKEYTNILRAQLSKYELLLLYFNCLSRYGSEKFKPLVEKYSLLKNISGDDELLHYDCDSLYDPSAFGK
jgi:hypothetical protein